MEAEHGEIDPILQACAAGFARLAERPDADARAALVVRLVAGRESLARHLAHEETDAITLIQRVMTDAEWRQVEDDYFKSQPIPPKLILKMLPWMFDKLPAPVREQRLAEAAAAVPRRLPAVPRQLPAHRATDLPVRRLTRSSAALIPWKLHPIGYSTVSIACAQSRKSSRPLAD